MRIQSLLALSISCCCLAFFPESAAAQTLRNLTPQEIDKIKFWSNTYIGLKLVGQNEVSFGRKLAFKNYNNFEIVSMTVRDDVRTGNHVFRSRPFTYKVFENRVIPHRGVLLPFDSCKELPAQWVTRPRSSWTTITNTTINIISAQTYATRNLNDFGCLISFLATTSNDEILRTLKSQPSLIKKKNMYGVTPLHAAFAGSDVAIAQYMLKNGASSKTRTKDGTSIMHFAVANWNPGAIELAMSHGFTVHDLSPQSKSVPLEKAVLRGTRESFTYLTDRNAKANHINGEGTSLLAMAIFEGNDFAFNWLISNGAKPQSLEGNGDTLIHVAARKNNIFINRLLARGFKADARNPKNGWTPLMYAVSNNDYETQELLLLKGANPNLKNNAGQDCFAIARRLDARSEEIFRQRVALVNKELARTRRP